MLRFGEKGDSGRCLKGDDARLPEGWELGGWGLAGLVGDLEAALDRLRVKDLGQGSRQAGRQAGRQAVRKGSGAGWQAERLHLRIHGRQASCA